MDENEIARIVVDAAIQIHRRLGPGLFESVYEIVLADELRKRGLRVERQAVISIKYAGMAIEAFRADLLVEGKVIVEIKCVEHLSRQHSRQLLTYLRLSELRLGLLLNFGQMLMKNGIVRMVNRFPDLEPSRPRPTRSQATRTK